MKGTFWIIPCLLLILTPVFSDEQLPREIRFEVLSTPQGLSSSSVSSILQDEDGVLWFGTQAGLNRYDGYDFTIFENDPFDRNSLSHNLIQTMHLDEDGTIWIGTYGGLNRFDTENRTFTTYAQKADDPSSLSNNVVVAITRDSQGTLWVGTLDGLNRMDEGTGTFTRYLPDGDDPRSLPDKVVRSLACDRSGNLWVGTYGGLSRYIPEVDGFRTWRSDPSDPEALPSPYVMAIREDPLREGLLWIGSWGGGITAFDVVTGRGKSYKLPAQEVYQLLIDSKQHIWAGTWGGGLVIMDPETGEVEHYRADEGAQGETSLSHNVVYSLLEDRSGIVWAGTNGGGVNKYVPWENRYRFIRNEAGNTESLAEGKINGILEDPDGTLWVGVYAGGLNRWDPDTGQVRRFLFQDDDPGSLSNNIVNSIYRDRQGELWVGTNDGLNRFISGEEGFIRILADGTDRTPPESIIYTITEMDDGTLWIGTNTSGIGILNKERSRWSVLSNDPDDPASLSDNLVRSIMKDSRGSVWVGTNRGLNRRDVGERGFHRYLYNPDDPSSLSSDNIRQVLEDSNGVLWIATAGGGLNRYDRENDTFSSITRKDGLLSNHIMTMTERNPGELWISTNRGLSVYNSLKRTFRTIDQSNGLLAGELTSGLALGRGGRLYVGSVDGITIIDQRMEDVEAFTPPLMVTSFEVMGEDRLFPLSGGEWPRLALDYSEKLFSFQVAALDYADPGRNQYAFKLEGFDREWIYSGTRNYTRYTNLDPGDYLLRIKGAGSRGNWNEEGLSIPIRILPPWWRSRWAFLAYLLLLALGVFFIIKMIHRRETASREKIRRQEALNEELEQKVVERTREIEEARREAEEATRAKSLFLANMSHEIRTPLTGLLGMLSLLERGKLGKDQREYVGNSRMAASTLNQLVNDLLDIESIESGKLRLHETTFSLRSAVEHVQNLFQDRASREGLELNLSVDTGSCDLVRGDQNRFIQIVTNLVSNAIKYTDAGSVSIRLKSETSSGINDGDVKVLLSIKDTGMGISGDKMDTIFQTFTQIESGYTKSSRGVGLGLSIVKELVNLMGGRIELSSEPGRGSIFTVHLNLPRGQEPEQPELQNQGYQGDQAGAANPGFADGTGDGPVGGPVAGTVTATAGKEAGGAILLCEDEGINRLYLGQYLEGAGYRVDLAADGREAVDQAKTGNYDLILMDLSMPEIDGLEASRIIRKDVSARVPIVALSAHSYQEDLLRTREAGMNDFISKPVDEVKLLETVKEWIGKGRDEA